MDSQSPPGLSKEFLSPSAGEPFVDPALKRPHENLSSAELVLSGKSIPCV